MTHSSIDAAALGTRATPAERWLPVAAWVALLGGGVLIVAGLGRYVPPCAFHELTGALCPGCGSGRALFALSRLDLPAAISANALVVVGLPFVLWGLVRESADAWGFSGKRRRSITWLPAVALLVILGFWVLRNVPFWPLVLLAPH